jgi:hypothetical protein
VTCGFSLGVSFQTITLIVRFLGILDADREQCMKYHKSAIDNEKEQCFSNRYLTELTDVPICLLQSNGDDEQIRSLSKNKVSDPHTRKPSKAISSGKRPSQTSSEFSIRNENRQGHGDHRQSASSTIVNSSAVGQDLRGNDSYQFGFDDPVDQSTELNEDTHNDVYLDKINSLSLKVNQQLSLIKERDDKLKRLRSTTIGKWLIHSNRVFPSRLDMPSDQATRDYLCYLAEKIRNQTTGHKYVGLLSNDAIRLGMKLDRMNEILNSKTGITSIAREFFKTMVPESDRQVDHWNKLPESVLLKEKLLIGTPS